MKGYKEFGDTASMLAISRKLISNYRKVVNLSQGSGYKQVRWYKPVVTTYIAENLVKQFPVVFDGNIYYINYHINYQNQLIAPLKPIEALCIYIYIYIYTTIL